MTFCIALDWLRITVYFLVVTKISKYILTLYEMLFNMAAFIFIFVCYLLLMACVFSTLFQDSNPRQYRGVFMAMRVIYDASLCVYSYQGAVQYEHFFMVMQEINIYITQM